MKLRKLIATAVAAATAITMCIPASATILEKETDSGAIIGPDAYLVLLYCSEGGADYAGGVPTKVATDYGYDVEKLAKLEVTFKMNSADYEKWNGYFEDGENVDEDQPAGSLVLSCNNNGVLADGVTSAGSLSTLENSAYNWQGYEFYGFGENAADPDAEDNTAATKLIENADGSFTVSRDDCIGKLSNKGSMVQLALQEWGTDWDWEVLNMRAYEADGTLIAEWDDLGYIVDGLLYTAAGDDDDDTTADDDDDTTDDDDDTTADDDDDTADDDDDTADDDDDTADDDDDDDAGKDSPDTGVEGIAVVAGLAIVAAGAIIVSKKRK